MLKTFANLFKVPELRFRIFFTIGLVAIARLLAMIPTPGVDWSAIMSLQENLARNASSGGLVDWFDTFTGGALTQCSVGTLSIWPYISAQIIIQLMTAVIPALGRLQREGDAGRKTLNLYIRWLTIGICVFQAVMLASTMLNPERLGAGDVDLVVINPFAFYLLTVISMTGTSMFVMWLGDQITERGIGNGVSLLIMINITSRLPVAVSDAVRRYFGVGGAQAQGSPWELILLLVFGFAVLLGTVALTQALRKIPIHSTRAISRGSSYGGGMTYLPLRVNYAGVMPIIFAGPILQLIGLLGRLEGANAFTAAALLALGKATPGATIVRREEMVEAVRPGQLIGVRRTFVNARGEPITALPHGELAYVRLDLTLPAATRDLALRDALPGGLEYEDPNLATRAQRPLPEWTEKLTRFTPTHTKNCGYEMRFFGDVPDAGTFTLVYPVRAVTRGVYRVPAVRVEAMYAPDLTGASAAPATFTVE